MVAAGCLAGLLQLLLRDWRVAAAVLFCLLPAISNGKAMPRCVAVDKIVDGG